MKKVLALLLAVVLAFSFAACHKKSENAVKVDDMIASIGEVSLDSSKKIEEIDKAIDGLTAEEKDDLDNLDDLQAAKDKVAELESEKRVNDVKDQINAIGKVTLKSEKAITKAEKALKKLSEEEQAKVDNASVLTDARNTYDKLKKEDLKKKKAEGQKILSAKFNKDVDDFQNTTFYQHKNTPQYIDTRSYILPYLAKTGDNWYVRVVYNYTGDDWVFFKTLTIVVDGHKYYKFFNYRDITHDNEGGNVWEYIDQQASDDDIKMLRAIAKSKSAKVRYQGDDFSYDLTIKDGDKNIIKDTLKAYDCFH